MTSDTLPDFVALLQSYTEDLSPGQRAEIRRSVHPDDLALSGAFYRVLPINAKPSVQMRRVVFFLSDAEHREEAGNIGRCLANTDKPVSEKRLFQMIRTNDHGLALQHLRRLCRMIKATVDWNLFGETLFYWGDHKKRQIIQDYYTAGGGE